MMSEDVPQVEMIDFRAKLNPQQFAAVTAAPGQSLVIAGAGSGKTTTLTYRVAYLLQNDISPENILLLTFTNKAAREMIDRVERLVGPKAARIWGGTFHSLGNRILRRHAEMIGLTRSFTILDADDQKVLLNRIIDESGVADTAGQKVAGRKKKDAGFPKAQVLSGIISYATNTCRSLRSVVNERYPYLAEFFSGIEKVADLYIDRKQKSNSLDFDDLLLQTLELLKNHERLRRFYQHQFQFILVDEYQDTNLLQSELIDVLAGEHGNIMVVGDDAQSIYSWRGANFENILKFHERHPQAQSYKIELNYRSVPEVLALANESIRQNQNQFEKNLAPTRPSRGQKPVVVALNTPAAQALFVAQQLRDLHEQEGIEWKDMAVLYRAHYQAMELQLQLTQDGVPFMITSGVRFFEQAHLKDVLAFLKWAANPQDEVSFDRMVQLLPGVGPGAAAKLWQAWQQSPAARQEKPTGKYSAILKSMKVPTKAAGAWEQLGLILDEFIDEAREDGLREPKSLLKSVIEGYYSDYLIVTFENARERQQDLEQLMVFSEKFSSLAEMLSELSLLTNADEATPKDQKGQGQKKSVPEDAVTLTTVHQAKGLEWKVVFIIWLTDGMFPNNRVVDEAGPEGLEEERRLFYVATTRAMDRLYLCYPYFWPKAYSGDAYQEPSLFLTEVDPSLMEEMLIRAF